MKIIEFIKILIYIKYIAKIHLKILYHNLFTYKVNYKQIINQLVSIYYTSC